MAALDPDDLAQAFAEESAPSPAPAYSPPSTTRYGAALRPLVRFLLAVQAAQPGTFDQALAQTPEPQDLTAAMQRVYSLSAKHLAAVYATMTNEQRQYFHSQCIALSEAVKDDMSDLSLAAALMRWIMQGGLPAVQDPAHPDTQSIFKKNFGALEYACKVARPDDTNPEFVKLMVQVKQLQEQKRLGGTSSSSSSSSTNINSNSSSSSSSSSTNSSSSSDGKVSTGAFVAILLLFIAALIGLIVVVVMYRKKSSACPQPAMSVMRQQSIPPPVSDTYAMLGGMGHYDTSFPSLTGSSFPI